MTETEKALAELRTRIATVLECPTSMCGHCIEILTEEIPATEALAEHEGRCTEFERDHLYQNGCSRCGKLESEHPEIRS